MLKSAPLGTELVVGSAFFLCRITRDAHWEVYLTPRRCHFRIAHNDLGREASQLVETALPRFVSLFTPEAKKVSPGADWTWKEVTEDVDFIYTPDNTEAQINAFCVMGNWVTLAGPYVFHQDCYGRRLWGWLRDINVPFVEEILGINFVSNDKPWLSPRNFGDFVIASNRPCRSCPDKWMRQLREESALKRESIKGKPERAREKVGRILKAQFDLHPFGSVCIDDERFDARVIGCYYVEKGDTIEIVDCEGVWLQVQGVLDPEQSPTNGCI